MRLTFDIVTADDARTAADVCESVAGVMDGGVSVQDATPARARRSRRAAAPQPFPGVPMSSVGQVESSKSDVLSSYNAIAAATGAPVIEPAPVVVVVEEAAEPAAPEVITTANAAAEIEAAATAQAELDQITAAAATAPVERTRAEIERVTKRLAIGMGFMWVRKNVTEVYGRTMLAELSDNELAGVHAQAVADAGPEAVAAAREVKVG